MIELDFYDAKFNQFISEFLPQTVISMRLDLNSNTRGQVEELAKSGIGVFHLLADYHGRSSDGQFIGDLIWKTHNHLVNSGIREEVTLVASGGIIAAEHVPKAIINGADLVGIDTTYMVALQGRFQGEGCDRERTDFTLPGKLSNDWGTQRIVNWVGATRDQLLEILGAMGMREVRRQRGEVGRAMFAKNLEEEAFSSIAGYQKR